MAWIVAAGSNISGGLEIEPEGNVTIMLHKSWLGCQLGVPKHTLHWSPETEEVPPLVMVGSLNDLGNL